MRGHPNSVSEGTFSAQSIIDAIIKHQISLGSSDSNTPSINRDLTRSSFYNSRQHTTQASSSTNAISESNKNISTNIINIDLDNDRSNTQHEASTTTNNSGRSNARSAAISSAVPHPATQSQQAMPPTSQAAPPSQTPPTHTLTKNITFGELTDSIIASDYVSNVLHMRSGSAAQPNYMPTYMQDAQGIVAPDRWKYNRRLQQKEVEAERNKIAMSSSSNSGVTSSGVVTVSSTGGVVNVSRSSTPQDERNIIRMPMSPRKYVHDLIMHTTANAGNAAPTTTGVVAVSEHGPAVSHYYQHAHPASSTSVNLGVQRNNLTPSASTQHLGVTVTTTGSSGSVVQNHHFDTMKYVKDRIEEAMRTEDDNRAATTTAGSGNNGSNTKDEQHERNNKELYVDNNSNTGHKTPNHYDERDTARRSAVTTSNGNTISLLTNDNNSNSSLNSSNSTATTPTSTTTSTMHTSHSTALGAYNTPPVTTYAATTYAYPYSALNVPPPVTPTHHSLGQNNTGGVGATVGGGIKTAVSLGLGSDTIGAVGSASIGSGGNNNSTTGVVGTALSVPVSEPKPLLSAQYEALSDED